MRSSRDDSDGRLQCEAGTNRPELRDESEGKLKTLALSETGDDDS